MQTKLDYLRELAQASSQACLVKAGGNMSINPEAPRYNTLGIDIYFPSGWSYAGYNAFWLRDFVMSVPMLDCTGEHLQRCVELFAQGQRSEDWHWHNGHVPAWTPSEHITMENGHCYYPGSYFADERQGGKWGPYPPMDNAFYFILLVYYAWQKSDDAFLRKTLEKASFFERAVRAYDAVYKDPDTSLPASPADKRAVDFGFCDTVHKIGCVLFGTCLAYQCANCLAQMAGSIGDSSRQQRFEKEAEHMQHITPQVFGHGDGFLMAATQVCRQRDVWGTAYAVYVGLVTGDARKAASHALLDAYCNKLAVRDGAVRHLLVGDDWAANTMWEYCTADHNTYQNGGYWLTASGWYIYAISCVDPVAGQRMFEQMIAHLKQTDFRQQTHRGPYEWHAPGTAEYGHAVNLTSICCPLEAMQRIGDEQLWPCREF